jgi:hypothetical protein
MKSLNKIMTTGICAEAIVVASDAHAAATGWNQNELKPQGVPTDLQLALENITNWILGFVAVIAVLIVIYGGLLYLTAAGNDDQVAKAKKTITTGIIGLIICGLAYALVKLVTGTIISGTGGGSTT